MNIESDNSEAEIRLYSSAHDSTFLGKVPVSTNLNNRGSSYYVIEQLKPGCISDYKVIYPTKANQPWIFVDLGIAATGAALWVGSDNPTAKGVGQILVNAVWGPIFGLGIKKYENDRVIHMDELKCVPKRKENHRHLVLKSAEVNIPVSSITSKFYSDIKKYNKGQSVNHQYYNNTNEKVLQGAIDKEIVRQVLDESGYIDSSKSLIPNHYNSYALSFEINKLNMEFIFTPDLYKVEAVTKWTIMDYMSKDSLKSFQYTTSSGLLPDVGYFKEKGMIHVVQESLWELLNDKDFQSMIRSAENEQKQRELEWETLEFNDSIYAGDLKRAVTSVVTIKKDDGHGSGVILSSDGYIITNYHVTGGQDENIEVILNDERSANARIVRYNPKFDLALLKIEMDSLLPVRVKPAYRGEVGEEVLSIGTPTDITFGQSVSRGIISGKRNNGSFDLIQTDASVNSGNSGGALITKEGELVGIINAKIVGVGVEGLGFAIPSVYIEEALKIKFNNK